MGTRNATPQAGDILSSCATPFPGSRICTLVTLGKNGLLYAPSDADVAHLEASFIGPDLRDLDNSLLRTGGNEEEERKALLERMRAHDLILNRIENQQSIDTPGGEFHTATNIGEDKICGDSDNQVQPNLLLIFLNALSSAKFILKDSPSNHTFSDPQSGNIVRL
jgi:hypothetical protein|tara:strand:- start:497 stop:991 length:495 start_codon:yes stop_codon:yes gene_type:complete